MSDDSVLTDPHPNLPPERGKELAPSPFQGEGWGEGAVKNRQRVMRFLPIFLILLFALLLRLFWLTEVPPGLTHDEANHGREAIGVLDGELLFYFPLNYGSEPLYSYTVAGSMLLFGENLFALRLVNVIFGVLAIAATYFWARWALSERVGLVTAVLMSVSFWPLASSREALRAGMLPFFMVCAVWFFWKILYSAPSTPTLTLPLSGGGDKAPSPSQGEGWGEGGENRKMIIKLVVGFGVSIAFTLHIYLAARVAWGLFPLFLIYLFIWRRATFKRSWLPTLAGLLLAGLLVTPMFIYVKLHPYVLERLDMLDGPLQALRQGHFVPILQNTGEALLAFVWPGYGDGFLAYNIPGRPVFDVVTAVFFIVGLVICLWRWKRPSYAFILFWFGVGIIPSLITGPTANTTRNLAALPAIFLIPSLGFWAVGDAVMRRMPRLTQPVLAGLAAVWILFAGAVAIYDYFVVWGQSVEVRDAYQHTLVEEVAYLKAQALPEPFVISSVLPNVAHDPSIYLVLQDGANWETRWVDARQALVVPAGSTATVVVPSATPLHPAFANLLQEVDTVALRANDLNPQFKVYELDGTVVDAWLVGDTAVTFNNAITLHHAEWLQPQVRPGETAELLTVWQIADPTQIGPKVPPLFTTNTAMFTQLLDENGQVFAQRDSLEAPSWNWHEGDILLHVHSLVIPQNTAVNTYPAIIGFYDYDSGQRAVLGNGESYTAVPNLDIIE